MAQSLTQPGTDCKVAESGAEGLGKPADDAYSLLLQLPDDALLTVCGHLPPTAVAALNACCRRLRKVTGDVRRRLLAVETVPSLQAQVYPEDAALRPAATLLLPALLQDPGCSCLPPVAV